MSFFVIHNKCADHVRAHDLCAVTERAGIACEPARLTCDMTYTKFYLPGAPPPVTHALEDGGWIDVYGNVRYRGETNSSAVRAMAHSIKTKTIDWNDVLGCFAAIWLSQSYVFIFTDVLGSSKIYYNDDMTSFSNAFLGASWLVSKPRLYVPACYEYAFGGSLYGQDTMIDQVKSCPPGSLITISKGNVTISGRGHWRRTEDRLVRARLDEISRLLTHRLTDVVQNFVGGKKNAVRLSLSGGYDSRLLLAVLLHLDVRPSSFTYGNSEDPDVIVASNIAKRFGLDWEPIDKLSTASTKSIDLEQAARRDFFAFDGFKPSNGIFSSGADFHDRLARAAGGVVVMNGSLGEIYRNFFYLPDREFGVSDVVSCFYSQYSPRAGGVFFNDAAYRSRISRQIAFALGVRAQVFDRPQVERVYPEFRGRYWTGRDAQLNQRFGAMWFPYMEPSVFEGTAQIPLSIKSLGILQGEMIKVLNEKLALEPSTYGHPLSGSRPAVAMVKGWLNERKPFWLRRTSYRLRARRDESRPRWLKQDFLGRLLDFELPYTRRLFVMNELHENSLYNRVMTIEYLAQTLNVEMPDFKISQAHWRFRPS